MIQLRQYLFFAVSVYAFFNLSISIVGELLAFTKY